MKKIYFLVVTFLFISLTVTAQKDSTAVKADSVSAKNLTDYKARLTALEEQRIADSIKKTGLEKQLSSLKTTDNLKKADLEQQLEQLNSRDAQRLAEKKARIESLRATAKAWPVKGFFNDTLFYIYAKRASFTAKERAAAVSERIKLLGDNFSFSADSIKIQSEDASTDLIRGESIIISLSDDDALWNNTTRADLANIYKAVIIKAVADYREKTSFSTIAKEVGFALLVLVTLGLIIYFLNKLFRWTATKIANEEGRKIKGVKIKEYSLFDASRQIKILLMLNTLTKWILILVLAYIALPILFGIFPQTENFADALFGYILRPVKKIAIGFWDYLPNLITIIVIVIIFRYVIKAARFLKNEIANGQLKIQGFYPDWANPTYQIVRILIIAFMVVVIFPYLPGSDSPIFKGVSVFLGFLFTFGSAGSLSNIIAGIVLTYMRLFRIGDRVEIGDVKGDVIEKSLLVTRIRTIKNEIISIPNSTIMNSHTINYTIDTAEKGLILHTTVTIGYDAPWKDVTNALLLAADRTDLLEKDPKPFVHQTSLDDFYVSYELNVYTKQANKQSHIYSHLHQNIQDTFNEAGIEIMSPHYRAARDGNMTTIPANYLDKDYTAPAFNVSSRKE
jgi:small-conductance mechanosensitive channel/TolA-binding protein